MIETFLACILFFIPFLLVICFEKKLKGFLMVFVCTAFFHISVALITQFFHTFTYPVVSFLNLLYAVVAIYYFFTTKKYYPIFSTKNNIKPIIFSVFTATLIFVELFSVHYSYSGPASTISNFSLEDHAVLPYPYFSDEWVGVALTNYSITNASLPLVNPFKHNTPFFNPLVIFFSLISEITLFLNTSALTFYPILALCQGLILCFLIFLYTYSETKSYSGALFAALALPLVVNGANLPGLWYVLPFISGCIFLFIGLIALKVHQKKLFLISSFISLLLYPPIIVFILPLLITMYARAFLEKKKFIYIGGTVIAAIVLIFVSISSILNVEKVFKGFHALIFRDNLVQGIPSFAVWKVLPFFILVFSFIGIVYLIRNKKDPVLVPLLVGVVFWMTYAFTTNVFIIDYPRIVVITSYLLVAYAGIGFANVIQKISASQYKYYVLPLEMSMGIIFIVIAASYPSNAWTKLYLTLNNGSQAVRISPASPINKYLTDEDLKLFSSIHNKNFLAPSWKGLVVGAATENYPLESKPSTISTKIYSYDVFVKSDCKEKSAAAKRYHIDYIYSSAFTCDAFEEIGSSSEKLVLYAVRKK